MFFIYWHKKEHSTDLQAVELAFLCLSLTLEERHWSKNVLSEFHYEISDAQNVQFGKFAEVSGRAPCFGSFKMQLCDSLKRGYTFYLS